MRADPNDTFMFWLHTAHALCGVRSMPGTEAIVWVPRSSAWKLLVLHSAAMLAAVQGSAGTDRKHSGSGFTEPYPLGDVANSG